ncbi:MAG: hypothetical protein Q4G13_07575 [Moraxella sp.]|nr:hypothetical protein [Moraxella sp.]
MSYVAPRQSVFAVIVLISFCLHVLFFVIIAEQKTQKMNETNAVRVATVLGSELGSALSRGDRVSMSVIAKRYEGGQLGYIGVLDTQDNLLVPVGQAANGNRVRHNIIYDGKVLGAVEVESPAVSRAGVLTDYWLLLLAMGVLHFFLWLVYGYVARPNEAMIDGIATNVRNQLFADGLLLNADAAHQPIADNPPTAANHLPSTTQTHDEDELSLQTFPIKPPPTVAVLPNSQDFVVQLTFVDPHNLLSALSKNVADAYFALCTQLLEKCVTELLASSYCTGVALQTITPFDERGARVYLIKNKDDAPLAMTAAMLVKLMPMLNTVVYDKHRELSYFALMMGAVGSDVERAAIARELLIKHKQPSMILLSQGDRAQVVTMMNLFAGKNPTTIHERECYAITEMSDQMATRLLQLRDRILLSHEDDR